MSLPFSKAIALIIFRNFRLTFCDPRLIFLNFRLRLKVLLLFQVLDLAAGFHGRSVGTRSVGPTQHIIIGTLSKYIDKIAASPVSCVFSHPYSVWQNYTETSL